jgi:4-hydroxy-2-oxoheptanedioate aldolase
MPTKHPNADSHAFWLETPSVPALEIARAIGLDTAIIDMEHGHGMTPDGLDHLIALGTALGVTMLVRVSESSRVPIQHALDAGAAGVILPQVTSAAHAAQVVAYAKYPPLGTRGLGYGRTMYHGTDDGFAEAENLRTRCFVMIETPGALEDADRIAALPCVDGLFIGPADLSMTRGRGLPGQTDADFADFERIAASARAAEKSWAMPATNAEVATFARKQGAAFLVVADDLSALRAGFWASLEAIGPRDRGGGGA